MELPTHRVLRLRLSEPTYDLLVSLAGSCDPLDWSGSLHHALRLLAWAKTQVSQGRTIVSIKDGVVVAEVVMPTED